MKLKNISEVVSGVTASVRRHFSILLCYIINFIIPS